MLAVFTNAVAAYGFGRPYITFYVSGLGFAASVAFCIGLPGLWEWAKNLTIILTFLALVIVYFRNGIRYGGRPE
jgi:hypothetical protein